MSSTGSKGLYDTPPHTQQSFLFISATRAGLSTVQRRFTAGFSASSPGSARTPKIEKDITLLSAVQHDAMARSARRTTTLPILTPSNRLRCGRDGRRIVRRVARGGLLQTSFRRGQQIQFQVMWISCLDSPPDSVVMSSATRSAFAISTSISISATSRVSRLMVGDG